MARNLEVSHMEQEVYRMLDTTDLITKGKEERKEFRFLDLSGGVVLVPNVKHCY
ncbi:hypothetical protein COLO4_25218 [Corchorus olitorius]|uniref:Uncharacterized protein n=1 Tax=Corchorus olitorius TaxID=93759 RepID=A0A1R3I456_9ROSI|nr:hypothetical protein COLO4_25218 [Corchorus olitorius]